MNSTKYIVVVGGVISGVGKGIATASIAKILKTHGFSVTAIKIDPYINCDAGTLRPTEHGEVWVTDDGGEIDQDLGNYERFLNIAIPKKNNITTGQIYRSIIEKERKGDFLGKTVQFIPHVPEEIKERIKSAAEGYDIALIEIGGTIGDYENIPFLFSVKSLERELGKENVTFVLVTYLPVPTNIEEMKTKPTQTSIKLLTEHGIIPDFILCRANKPLDVVRKKKIETYANIPADHVISAPDVTSTYTVPLNYEQEQLGKKLLQELHLTAKQEPNWESWRQLVNNLEHSNKRVNIAIIGKYLDIGNYTLNDSYISVNESLKHAAAHLDCTVAIHWIDAKQFEEQPTSVASLSEFDGIIVPGGFGSSGIEGKIAAVKYAREQKIPFLGLCLGLQMAIIEYARNVCQIPEAHTIEVNPDTPHPIINILPEQQAVTEKGGTMRLGSYAASLVPGTKIYDLYDTTGRLAKDQPLIATAEEKRMGQCQDNIVFERHRHRYEVNPTYIETLEKHGLVVSGSHTRKDGTKLVEFIEYPDSFGVALQGHCEFKSSLEDPSPLFYGLVKAALEKITIPA